MQLEATASHPITSYLGEETNTRLTPTSFQVVVESNKVSPQPPLLQTEQPQLPQPPLVRLVLQTPHQPRCHSPDVLTALKVRPHQCQGQGHDPAPTGDAIPDPSQDAVGLLGHLGTLLAHVQPAVDQHPKILFRWAAF